MALYAIEERRQGQPPDSKAVARGAVRFWIERVSKTFHQNVGALAPDLA